MLTDRPPSKPVLLREFRQSDELDALDVPPDDRLLVPARSVETAMASEDRKAVRMACTEFLKQASDFYHVSIPPVRVLAVRPLRIREGGWGTELFGDYDPESKLIRVWLRTAVRRQVTSFGTFLSTLCHEFCHHLDFELFGFPDSWRIRRIASPLGHTRQRVRRALGLSEDFVLHSLRHTFLTRYGAAGASAFDIMRVAGHASIGTFIQLPKHSNDPSIGWSCTIKSTRPPPGCYNEQRPPLPLGHYSATCGGGGPSSKSFRYNDRARSSIGRASDS